MKTSLIFIEIIQSSHEGGNHLVEIST